VIAGLKLHRLGTLMKPEPGNPLEAEGVLNPAATRGTDGQLYLFPRLVAKGNYSRIGIARVQFNSAGDPSGVERLGIALEPEADYEVRPDGSGGCEDPRVTFVEPLGHYVMTYTAYSPVGPRIALAISKDLLNWERLGLVTFEPFEGIEFDGIDDKDASVFPTAVMNPFGEPALAILHRPLFPGTRPEEKSKKRELGVRDVHRESIWISYRLMSINGRGPTRLCHFTSHHRLAAPVSPWEHLKIGGGTPPVLTPQGWLLLYHGVREEPANNDGAHPLCYSAGVMVLAKGHPREILYRSKEPVLKPELPEERIGTIGDVVFPTGIDRRDDLGLPNRFDVYYGMADDRIGVARLDLPAAVADMEQELLGSRLDLLDKGLELEHPVQICKGGRYQE
jgi:beta-1,2-mannobiose phosphorylase / 1,2-beta-oligomannan phosphorylase